MYFHSRTRATVWFLSLSSILLLTSSGTLLSRLPEPDALWWGTMTHNSGQALASSAGSPIAVVAKYNGVIVAQDSVPSGSTTYVLKVPLDDNFDPRVPGTVRPGERVRIFLKNTATNLEYEALETRTGPTVNGSVVSGRGVVYTLNLSVPENLNTGGALMAAFAVWAQAYPAVNPSLANRDTDGDGMTDFQEFLSDTDPASGGSALRILQIARSPGVNSIRFGPLRLGRVYSIFYTATLSNPAWQKNGEVTPSASAAAVWFDHVSASPPGFYRVEVGIQ